jgi:hypothetical protein
MRSHTCQSIYRCGEDADGALVDFLGGCSGNSGCLPNQASGNEVHEKCFHNTRFVMAVMLHGPSFMGYLKRKIFICKPRSIEERNQRIEEETAAILKQMTCRVTENRRGKLE